MIKEVASLVEDLSTIFVRALHDSPVPSGRHVLLFIYLEVSGVRYIL